MAAGDAFRVFCYQNQTTAVSQLGWTVHNKNEAPLQILNYFRNEECEKLVDMENYAADCCFLEDGTP
jgi:hypothetical protein